jgi:hypothetical protein
MCIRHVSSLAVLVLVVAMECQGGEDILNDKWMVRSRAVGTKHVYVGAVRVASKLSPGEACCREANCGTRG